MTEPYTPTEAIARGRWLNDNPSAREAFDRFLAQVRAEARREGTLEALREAADATGREGLREWLRVRAHLIEHGGAW